MFWTLCNAVLERTTPCQDVAILCSVCSLFALYVVYIRYLWYVKTTRIACLTQTSTLIMTNIHCHCHNTITQSTTILTDSELLERVLIKEVLSSTSSFTDASTRLLTWQRWRHQQKGYERTCMVTAASCWGACHLHCHSLQHLHLAKGTQMCHELLAAFWGCVCPIVL